MLLAASVIGCSTANTQSLATLTNTSPTGRSASPNHSAVIRLREALLRDYSHRDRLGIRWDAEIDGIAPSLETATGPADFAKLLVRLLEKAEDGHITVEVGEERLKPSPPQPAYNIDKPALARSLPSIRDFGKWVSISQLPDGTAYLLVAAWKDEMRTNLQSALDELRKMKGIRTIIIDVRPNRGGDDEVAAHLAGCFIDKARTYGFVRNFADGHLGPRIDRVISPTVGCELRPEKVAVLMGKMCASSTESFLLMMRQASGTIFVGETSRGSSGNPRRIDLDNGVAVWLPQWQEFSPDGVAIEGHGIEPTVTVTWPSNPTSDVVLEAALAALKGRPGQR